MGFSDDLILHGLFCRSVYLAQISRWLSVFKLATNLVKKLSGIHKDIMCVYVSECVGVCVCFYNHLAF